VPRRGLELFAVGLDRFENAIDEELDSVAAGRGRFKAVRGEYGTGKTFFARWLEHRARHRGFATSLVQISESETPLYKLQTVYRRCIEALETQEWSQGAFASLIDRWLYSLEEEVLTGGGQPRRSRGRSAWRSGTCSSGASPTSARPSPSTRPRSGAATTARLRWRPRHRARADRLADGPAQCRRVAQARRRHQG
jgi:hypothetical protein